MNEPIQYGVTHCPHCEREYAPAEALAALHEVPPVAYDQHYCYGCPFPVSLCSTLAPAAQDEHLIAVLQERDALRTELTNIHRGQLSLLAVLNLEAGADAGGGRA